MGNTLNLSNSIHLECISLTASAVPNTQYTVLNSNATYDRRIYAFLSSCNDANVQNLKVYFSDGTTSYQIMYEPLPANSGNSISVGPVDLHGDSLTVPILSKRVDVMGVGYFNLPTGWSIKALYTGTQLSVGESINFISYGEIYDGFSHRFTSSTFEETTAFTNATGTTETEIIASAVYDRRIYSISASSTDVTARTLSIRLRYLGTSYLVYTISILANSGNSTTIKNCDIFDDTNGFAVALFVKTYEPDGGYYFNLPAGWSVTGTMAASVAIGATIAIKATGDTYE